MYELGDSNILTETIKAILQNTKDYMFVKDKNFVYVGASESFATDCAGCSSVQELIGKTDYDLFSDPQIAGKYRREDERLFTKEEKVMDFPEYLPLKDGSKCLCRTAKYLLFDQDGNPEGILGQYHDISMEVEAEIRARKDTDRKIAKALNRIFFASNYVDLRTGEYLILDSVDYSRQMLEHCKNIDEAFAMFIQTLVKPEYVEKMQKFCESSTIAERVKGQTHIDCEYFSKVAKVWCQASFIPVDWDENGEVTHVLFVVSKIDAGKVKDIEEGIENKKSLNALFDRVPGGIVMYEWDGEKLKTLHISNYYDNLYGESMVSSSANNEGGPDFSRIHPDDLADYQKAIHTALTQTHSLEYVYRVWNEEKNRYIWLKINAVSEIQEDGTSLVYAMYSDVTKQKDAEKELAKRQVILEAALSVSNQICCEYDPLLHTLECVTEENFFGFPKKCNQYPECLKQMDLIHPDDLEKYLSAVWEVEGTNENVHCDVRMKYHSVYHWYSCNFGPYYDPDKGRTIAILTIIDDSMRVTSIQNYKDRLKLIVGGQQDALMFSYFNLSRNTLDKVRATEELDAIASAHKNVDDMMQEASSHVIGEADRNYYRKLFTTANLKHLFEQGQTHVQMEHLFQFAPDHIEWIETAFDMVGNPITGEIVGVCYVKSVNQARISNMLLHRVLACDFSKAAVVYVNTGEYYLYDTATGEYCAQKTHFWEQLIQSISQFMDEDTAKIARKKIKRERILFALETYGEFVYTFSREDNGELCRMEARCVYIDKEQHLIMASLRNITDPALLEQYKYDSEHDHLTGLLNRQSVFQRCKSLLERYPKKQFVMLHCDIAHFHLYNNFYGEKAGDDLLRRMADIIRGMGKNYEFGAYGRIQSDVFCAFFSTEDSNLEQIIRYFFSEMEKIQGDFLIEPIIGLYRVTDTTMSIESMFTRATIAAKSHEKNLFDLISEYDEKMEMELDGRQEITSEMQNAIDHEQFQVYLQPKYSLRTKKIVGAEALVRWIHPEKGIISPGRFIPLFEKNGFISELDHYMWEHVCILLQKWKREGRTLLPVSVNISRVSMYSHTTVPFLKSLVQRYGIEPKYLELELTESAYMDDPEEMKCQLMELQKFGFKILMDDFGSGYSSLNTLKELPVDILKLDMKFLSASTQDPRTRIVLSSVVRMSKMLSLPVIAEGVEVDEQADYLRSIGCEYVQGYLFAKPMPVDEYEKKINQCENSAKEESRSEQSAVQGNINFEAVAFPMAILEYSSNKFAFLQANQMFLSEFELLENLAPASKVFREHMDDDNYTKMLRAFEVCVSTQKSSAFKIEWNSMEQKREYTAYVTFSEKLGEECLLTVWFMNTTDL